MAAATFETAIAAGTTESLDRVVESAEDLSAEDVRTALDVCDFIRAMFKKSRTSIERALSEGIDAKAFVARYERTVGTLDTVQGAVNRVLTRLKRSALPILGEELLSRYEDLDAEIASLRRLLHEALEKAKRPLRSFDWQHAREVEEAHARGETKPFRKTVGKRSGS